MEIVLVNSSDNYGGAAIAAFRYGEMLNEVTNVSVKLLVNEKKKEEKWIQGLDRNNIELFFNFCRFCLERLKFYVFEKDKSVRFAFSPANIGRIIHDLDIIKKSDVIHLHWINKAFLSITELGALTYMNKPVFWTIHDMWSFTGGCHHHRGCNNFMASCGNCHYLNKKFQSKTDLSNFVLSEKIKKFKTPQLHIICPSQWLANLAKKSKLFSETTIHVLPNPINTSVFVKLDKKLSKINLGLQPEKIYLLFVAANISNEYKGLKYLYDALNLIGQNTHLQEKVELLVVGGKKSDISTISTFKVHNLGYVLDQLIMVQIYNASELFITPSLEENLPNTIMEAMSCGTPCVGFDTGGVSELIDHKVSGYVATFKDVDDLASGIIYCLEEQDRYDNFSANSIRKAKLNYDYGVVSKKLIDLYSAAINDVNQL